MPFFSSYGISKVPYEDATDQDEELTVAEQDTEETASKEQQGRSSPRTLSPPTRPSSPPLRPFNIPLIPPSQLVASMEQTVSGVAIPQPPAPRINRQRLPSLLPENTPPSISFLEQLAAAANDHSAAVSAIHTRPSVQMHPEIQTHLHTDTQTHVQQMPSHQMPLPLHTPNPRVFTQQPPPHTPVHTPPHPHLLHTQRSPRPPSIFRPPSVDWTLKLFRLDDFVLGRTVGTGTFGRVRLARLREHDKYFAMKIMRKTDIVRLHQVDHIFSERMLLSRLSCPFIIRLYGAFKDVDHLYMLLEYAVGGELFTFMRRSLRLPPAATRFYAAEIILALDYMHGLGIVYRDLKPENLLLDARGHVKIADFGFAKVVPENVTWTLCGTPEYLAPEIILGRGHGRPVDWWALGVLIYEMLAGFPPYYHDTPFQIYEKILAGGLVFPDFFEPRVCDLLLRLLESDPQKRLGSGIGGAHDVMAHPWFEGVDWDAVGRRLVAPPFTPPVAHPGDTSNFEEYSEEQPQSPSGAADNVPVQDLDAVFADF